MLLISILLPDGFMMGSMVVASVGKTAANVAFCAAADGTEEFVESVEWCCAVF